jgi:hypothetical protein
MLNNILLGNENMGKVHICTILALSLIFIQVSIAEQEDLKITDHTTAKYAQSENPWDAVDRTVNFYISDSKVYSWFEVKAVNGLIYKGHTYKWVFTSPDGKIQQVGNTSTSSNTNGFSWAHVSEYLDLKSIDAINNTGVWHIDFYIDDKYYMSDGFYLHN